jgi:hypothetical protein
MAKKALIEAALKIMGERFVETIQAQIVKKGLFKTGNLARSVEYRVLGKVMTISMVDYGIYLDSGVKGTTKNTVVPDSNSLFAPGQFKSKVIGGPLPFAVRKSIAQKGLEPKPFILPAYNGNIAYIEEPLINGIRDDIQVRVEDEMKKYGVKIET